MRILICLLFSIVAVDFAAAACKINLRVKNETKYAIELEDGRKSFQVKTRAAPWRNVHRGGWDWYPNAATRDMSNPDGRQGTASAAYRLLESGKTIVDNYDAVLGCGVKRRYRIDFTCHEVVEKSGGIGLEFTGEGKDVATKTRYFPGPKDRLLASDYFLAAWTSLEKGEPWTESRNVTIPIKSCK